MSIKGSKNNINLFSLLDHLYLQIIEKHLFPNKGEFNSVFGGNIIVQSDEIVLRIQKNIFRKIKINLKYVSLSDQILILHLLKDYKLKKYTIFVHDTYWDLEPVSISFYKFIKPKI